MRSYSYRGYRPLTAGRTRLAEAMNQRRKPGDRPRVVAGNEVVDVWHGRPHPDRQRLHIELGGPRVDPDQTASLQLQPPSLAGKELGIAPVPAVAEDDHDRPAGQAAASPDPIELAKRRADPGSARPVADSRPGLLQRPADIPIAERGSRAASGSSRRRRPRPGFPPRRQHEATQAGLASSAPSTRRHRRAEPAGGVAARTDDQAGSSVSPSVRSARLTVRRRSSRPRRREGRSRRETRSGWARRSWSPRTRTASSSSALVLEPIPTPSRSSPGCRRRGHHAAGPGRVPGRPPSGSPGRPAKRLHRVDGPNDPRAGIAAEIRHRAEARAFAGLSLHARPSALAGPSASDRSRTASKTRSNTGISCGPRRKQARAAHRT